MAINKEKLLQQFNKNMGKFTFNTSNLQRMQIRSSYQMKDGHHFTNNEISDRDNLGKKSTIINIAAPLVRAVSGSEVMQDKKLQFVPMDDQFDKKADVMDKVNSYIQYVSDYDAQRSLAVEDALTCGIGATVTWLDMTQIDSIVGKPVCQRIFPLFLIYDTATRGGNINRDSKFCGYADPVDRDSLTEYMKEELESDDLPTGASSYSEYFLDFARNTDISQVDMLYHYFWWDFEPVYHVANPFTKNEDLIQLAQQDEAIGKAFSEFTAAAKVDMMSSFWVLRGESYKKWKDTFEVVQALAPFEIEKPTVNKRRGKCYYRAEIARGVVIKAEESFCQDGFQLNFLTGYYDESESCYYGLMRPMQEVQRSLDFAMSDLMTYVDNITSGGSAYVKGSIDSLEKLNKSRKNQAQLTPLLGDVEVIPKATPDTPQVLVNVVNMLVELTPRTVGIGQEFLGVITSGDMTDSLYGKVMKQSYAVLANFTNPNANYSVRQGEINISLGKMMAEMEEGRSIPLFQTNEEGEDTFRLWSQSIADKYAIRIVERPLTTDERLDTANALSQLIPLATQAGVNPAPLFALYSKYSRLDMADRKILEQVATPQPPQPDPVNQALLESQTNLQNAQAKKYAADAELSLVKAQKEMQGEGLQPDADLSRKLDHEEAALILKHKQEERAFELKERELELQERELEARLESEHEAKEAEIQVKVATALADIRDKEMDTALKEQQFISNGALQSAQLNELKRVSVNNDAIESLAATLADMNEGLSGKIMESHEKLREEILNKPSGTSILSLPNTKEAEAIRAEMAALKEEINKPKKKTKRKVKIITDKDGEPIGAEEVD